MMFGGRVMYLQNINNPASIVREKNENYCLETAEKVQ